MYTVDKITLRFLIKKIYLVSSDGAYSDIKKVQENPPGYFVCYTLQLGIRQISDPS